MPFPDMSGSFERSVARRRLPVVAVVLAGLFAVTWAAGPFLKTLTTEWYADGRTLFGIPNFLSVASNLPFLLVGVAGLVLCARTPRTAPARPAWVVFYAGMALTCFGSAWYHLAPTDGTIVWDRLGMVTAFVGLAAAVIAESTHVRISAPLLALALLCGATSVLWWRRSGDLRVYAWVQLAPLACAVTALTLGWLAPRLARVLGASLALYVLAKLAETFDARVYDLTAQAVSGHTFKHLLAAASAAVLLVWQWRPEAVVES